MGSINFELFAGTIEVSVIIESASGGDFRNVMAVLDTGAAVSVIPTRLALELGYDLSKADQVEFVSATDVECRPLINVRSLTAIKETVSDIEVVCRDLPRSCLDSDEDSEAEA
ncbi:hypothetical protein F4Y19_10165, partial [Candidatus Poribacteria bacterium]|nr:hypothetical protein [Candidatus Poribacteria bacterium]